VLATLVTVSVVLSIIVPGRQPILRLFRAGHYEIEAGRGAAAKALATIPADASVVAQASLLPHLSQRERIFVLNAQAPDAAYVIASMNQSPWPTSGRDEVVRLIEERRARGYVTIFDEAGWIVLKGRAFAPVRQAIQERLFVLPSRSAGPQPARRDLSGQRLSPG
jgi:hypothetical protein